VASPRVNGELTQVIGHLLGVYQLTSNQIPQITICNTEAEGCKKILKNINIHLKSPNF
jgi:hypothetical protein